ncbi:MAG: hypothetical protein RLZZ127_2074 [Planctomycetota bacterium]|jgi:PadR family transcriptional regulator PadR
MDRYLDGWKIQLRKGLLEVAVLNALRDGEQYGYDLARSLADGPEGDLGEGTLYPLLSRLRQQGLVATRLVESPNGPARKYYRLTADGLRTLAAMNDHLDTLAAGWRRRTRKG